ncbi:hypothetical protein TTHERM_00770660 (macronuclear) [Tetrahymena thermophila SB210]|uniref:Uncharacterized protein n=1 Tax=Tetrahymena thermophila (strain SB210) TaxID=312017 RepID=Q23AS9_TETTS|nr:hypothetical protein TTHERM_00770660 [Tetrahymena thermophila SB210]EAR93613.1 hypothetical protein TTHERM_00770660 [Tetrahymena thermophila SB210]|eukprot:XP_001013858.1 hypothetical protein TTHERM_00770660 [Tetrahymena thermophila SB210]
MSILDSSLSSQSSIIVNQIPLFGQLDINDSQNQKNDENNVVGQEAEQSKDVQYNSSLFQDQQTLSEDKLAIPKYKQLLKKKVSRKKVNKMKKVDYSIINVADSYLFNQIFQFQKHYILPGGIIIELEWQKDQIDHQVVGSLKTIEHVNKFNDGVISIYVNNTAIVSHYEYVISLLERSQDQDKYYISKLIRLYQAPISLLTHQIIQIIDRYEEKQLIDIVQKRKQFIEQKAQELSQTYLQGDEFTTLVTFQINWEQKTTQLTSFYFSKAILALLGTVNEDYIIYVMRNGLFQMFNGYSRRKIMECSIKYYIDQHRVFEEIPDFELMTLDNIVIKCCTQLHTFRVQFPEELQFFNENQSQINGIESVVLFKFILTQEHLERIIKLRQQIIDQNSEIYSQNGQSEDQESKQIAQNFEYYMQSELFLQKFYNEKYESIINTKKKQQQVCSYKPIVV